MDSIRFPLAKYQRIYYFSIEFNFISSFFLLIFIDLMNLLLYLFYIHAKLSFYLLKLFFALFSRWFLYLYWFISLFLFLSWSLFDFWIVIKTNFDFVVICLFDIGQNFSYFLVSSHFL